MAVTGRIARGVTAGLITVLGPTIAASAPPASEAKAPAPPLPWVSRTVAPPLHSKLEAAFRLAARQLRTEPTCRELFSELGTDGVEVLSATLYYPASLEMERRVCPHANAYTVVGGAPTWVCRRTLLLSDRRVARILVHEALHHAGIDEQQHDPSAPSSADLNDLVEAACGL